MKSTKKDYWRGSSGCALRRSLLDTPLKTPCDGGQRHAWSGPSPGRFLGGRMVIAIITCYILSCLPMNMKLPAVRLRFTRVLTPKYTEGERLQRLDREEQSWDICRGQGDAHWIRWCWIQILRQSQRSKEQKTNDAMGRIVEQKKNLPLQEQLFFLTEYPDEPRAWCSSARCESVVRVLSWSQSPLTFERAANYHLYTVCSCMQLPSSKPSLMFLNL